MDRFDVIVVGLGGVGSAAAYHLARRGQRVLGLERFGLAHARGSSHGDTRIVHRGYARAGYLPLIERSLLAWGELEERTGRRLLRRTGVLMVSEGSRRSHLERVRATAREHGVHLEEFDARRLDVWFPQFRMRRTDACVLEGGAGFVLVEDSVRAHGSLARAHGADLHFDEPATSWQSDGAGVVVRTSKGHYAAGALVVAGGAWAAELLDALGLPLVVERIPQAWYSAAPVWSADLDAPCFIFDLEAGYFSGIPGLEPGTLKVTGRGCRTRVDDPSRLDRGLTAEERAAIGTFIEGHLAGVSLVPRREAACMCTMTPEEDFIVDVHPEFPCVVFAAGLSGHGYKFAPVLGEALADLAAEGTTRLPIDFLRSRAPA